MRYMLICALFLIFGLSLAAEGYAQEEPKSEVQEEVKSKSAESDEGEIFNTVCPVSGEEIDPERTYTYEGKTYALCCNSCLKKFKADPEKYIQRLSEDGKSIKKKNKQS